MRNGIIKAQWKGGGHDAICSQGRDYFLLGRCYSG